MIHRGFAIQASNKNSSQALTFIVKDAASSLSDWKIMLLVNLCVVDERFMPVVQLQAFNAKPDLGYFSQLRIV